MQARSVGLAGIGALLLAVSAAAVERGTPAEARSMLAKAAAHYKSVGRESALADFNAKKAPFGDRDLYVFCFGKDHIVVANGGFPSLVGRTAGALKDASGKPIVDVMWEIASSKGEGSLEYEWINPVSHKVEPKISFVQKLGDDVCAVGAYNPK